MAEEFNLYAGAYGKDHRIWFDCVTKTCFGHGFIQHNKPTEYSYLTDKGDFVNHGHWGKTYVDQKFVPNVGKNYVVEKECIYHNHKRFQDYKGKSLLMIGAGPSTLEYDWRSVKTDYIWSCNHFFLHPHLSKTEVDLFLISNEVKVLHDKSLHAYMKRFPISLACFETTSRPEAQINQFNKRFKKRVTYIHTRYRSKLGSMPRLMVFASMLGFEKIYFVGMDGRPVAGTPHAFQPGKRLKGAPTKPGAADIFRRQYVTFWDYMLSVLKSPVEFYNLGEGVEGNLSTDISLDRFPLSRMEIS